MIENHGLSARQCGSCMMCCKVIAIQELDKPAGKWCVHARSGKGCTIHLERPNVCRSFFCEWINDQNLPDHWKPDKSKFIIARTSNQYVVDVDQAAPSAWKQPQYYPALKELATRMLEQDISMMICIGLRRIIVLPDRDEDFGLVGDTRSFFIKRVVENGTLRYSIEIS